MISEGQSKFSLIQRGVEITVETKKASDFQEIAQDLFDVLDHQGFFDFEANYSPNMKSITIIAHKEYFRYNIWVKTENNDIWDPECISPPVFCHLP